MWRLLSFSMEMAKNAILGVAADAIHQNVADPATRQNAIAVVVSAISNIHLPTALAGPLHAVLPHSAITWSPEDLQKAEKAWWQTVVDQGDVSVGASFAAGAQWAADLIGVSIQQGLAAHAGHGEGEAAATASAGEGQEAQGNEVHVSSVNQAGGVTTAEVVSEAVNVGEKIATGNDAGAVSEVISDVVHVVELHEAPAEVVKADGYATSEALQTEANPTPSTALPTGNQPLSVELADAAPVTRAEPATDVVNEDPKPAALAQVVAGSETPANLS